MTGDGFTIVQTLVQSCWDAETPSLSYRVYKALYRDLIMTST
jgi:hypothetical protein